MKKLKGIKWQKFDSAAIITFTLGGLALGACVGNVALCTVVAVVVGSAMILSFKLFRMPWFD